MWINRHTTVLHCIYSVQRLLELAEQIWSDRAAILEWQWAGENKRFSKEEDNQLIRLRSSPLECAVNGSFSGKTAFLDSFNLLREAWKGKIITKTVLSSQVKRISWIPRYLQPR